MRPDVTASDYQRYKGQRPTRAAPAAGKLAPTTPDILGPFWKDGAPERPDGRLCGPHEGKPLVVSGRVIDTNGNPAEAVLDVWQADANGVYDNDGFQFRGKIKTALDDRGQVYVIRTIRPGDYKISDPGQPDEFRCAHIHVKVTAPGFKPLTTQLYFPDDKFNSTDHWFSESRVIRDGRFDFVLERQ
jgi:protocatechuate 3,4-dioxygenase beta subunit